MLLKTNIVAHHHHHHQHCAFAEIPRIIRVKRKACRRPYVDVFNLIYYCVYVVLLVRRRQKSINIENAVNNSGGGGMECLRFSATTIERDRANEKKIA